MSDGNVASDGVLDKETESGVLNNITESHGYPVEEGAVEVAHYLAGAVDRENELILVRMGNDDGTILESPLLLEEAQSVIVALQGNVIELTQIIDINSGNGGGVLDLMATTIGKAVTEGNFPVMQLLVEWIEQNNLWPDFAAWASEAVDDDGADDDDGF